MKKKTVSALTLALTAAASLTLGACGSSSAAATVSAAPAEAITASAAEPAPAKTTAGTIDTIMTVGTAQSFTDEAVPSEVIETILQAGLAAESATNQQPWFFVAVTNKDVMSELSASGGMPGGEGMPSMPGGEAPEMPYGEAPAMPNGTDMPAAPSDGKMPEGFPGGAPGAAGAKAALGDSPLAVIVYMDRNTSSPSPEFDCGLAVQNMYITAASLGYGVKIVSSPTMTLNGANHDQICEKLGVDSSLTAVAVLLIGKTDESTDTVSSASVRSGLSDKTAVIE